MLKEKLEDLSIEKLRKRKKIYFVLQRITFGYAIINIIVFILAIILSWEMELFAVFAFLWNIFGGFLFSLGFNKGAKKFNGEISRRENK